MKQGQSTNEVIEFEQPIPVTIRRLRIKRAASLAYLDVAKLSRAANAEFDFGHVAAGKCRSVVKAIVKKGMVVGLNVEGCNDCEPMKIGPEFQRVLESVRKRLYSEGEQPPPQTVPEFLAQQVPERSRPFLICFIFFCVICTGFPSDPKSWSCHTVGRSFPRPKKKA